MLYEYDATKERCPLPLVKLRVILKKMQADDSCRLLIADKGSRKDIPALLTRQGYDYSLKKISDSMVELHIENK
ncbi:MAG: sulfurtransferase TusA family protein [Alteromonadaceae bacterium]|nr:sulfurtransferase TusA family protein [Alteromonadaceae bacterium]